MIVLYCALRWYDQNINFTKLVLPHPCRNISYNNLAGVIPTSNNFSRFPPESFIGKYPGLCGYWLNSSCHDSHPAERGIHIYSLSQHYVSNL
ncbi:hypothetical protein NC652_039398 [Populus alba x Populus x berolinensis]|nr:hypothetical protein NC652_039398 [Populus alba x Populus x berolinensis]